LLDRFVLLNGTLPVVQMLLGLLLIYTGFIASVALGSILVGVVEASEFGWYLLARDVIALEVLVPTAAFLGVVVGVTRLHSNREAYAFYSSGVSPGRFTLSVVLFGCLVAALVFVLTNYGRPWAYMKSDQIINVGGDFQLEAIQPRQFEDLGDGIILFARRVRRDVGLLEDVFVSRKLPGEMDVVRAETAKILTAENGRQRLLFTNGHEYKVSLLDGADRTSKFATLSMLLERPSAELVEQRRKAKGTQMLALSSRPQDVAELQWRRCLPMISLLLVLFGIRMGRAAPGQNIASRVWSALLFYLIIFMAASALRTQVENAKVDLFPGMYLLVFAMAIVYLIVIYRDSRRRIRSG
jgi:lipopolysaccharide export system permease protein